MRLLFGGGVLAGVLSAALVVAQVPASPEPFKLGTFEQGGRTFVGLVIKDTIVVDLEAANLSYERDSAASLAIVLASDMKALLEQYGEEPIRQRVHAIASMASAAVAGSGYLRDLKSVRIRPPVLKPGTILNSALNFKEHASEMARLEGGAGAAARRSDSIPGLWPRKPNDTRQSPYLYLKPPSAVIGDGDAIRLPPGRDQIDWECELAVVVGRTASRVSVERAADYIFGYTLENDVSDRGGRHDGRHGSDWLIGKGHDTFAPMGPFIVPREFVKDPQRLAVRFTLNGRIMQDSTTDRMTHNVYEMVSFASHILTLRPGDMIAMGTPAGVGTARSTPIYFKPGDLSVCAIESIGTLTNPVVGSVPLSSTAQ